MWDCAIISRPKDPAICLSIYGSPKREAAAKAVEAFVVEEMGVWEDTKIRRNRGDGADQSECVAGTKDQSLGNGRVAVLHGIMGVCRRGLHRERCGLVFGPRTRLEELLMRGSLLVINPISLRSSVRSYFWSYNLVECLLGPGSTGIGQ